MIRLAACLICLAGSLAAQNASDMLDAASQQLQVAQTARDRIAALTQTVQAYETGLAALRDEQRLLAQEEASLRAQVTAQQSDIAELLGILATISRTPTPVQNAHPAGPVASIRAGMLAADLVPALQTRAEDISVLQKAARDAQSAVAGLEQTLTAGLDGAQVARAALGQAMSERRDLPTRFADDLVQSALLVAAATDLDTFTQEITAARAGQQTQISANGTLALPVVGQVQVEGDGLRIVAPAHALVTAPIGATVLFQGPLLDYGQVVILEPAADVLFVFGGLGKVFVTAGEIMDAGGAIGLLAVQHTADDGILTTNVGPATSNAMQSLYLEVREGQAVVNPETWFALDETRN